MGNRVIGRSFAAACVLAAFAGIGATAQAAEPGTYQGITGPSQQRGLNFNVPGVVSKVFVKEGDVIPKGKEVAREDDSVELAELIVKEAEAKSSELQITAAKADLDQKKVELKRSEQMYAKNVIGLSELEKARLDVTIGDIRVLLASQETDQKRKEADAHRARIAQKKLFSTIDGESVVQKINVHEGELATNDPKTPCIQIVSNFPLSVDVDVPVAESKHLAMGMLMEVRYTDESTWQTAPINYINPVANAASGTQRIHLELDNSKRKLRSGLQVEVRLAQKNGVAGASAGQ